jgi:hypothetical protein
MPKDRHAQERYRPRYLVLPEPRGSVEHTTSWVVVDSEVYGSDRYERGRFPFTQGDQRDRARAYKEAEALAGRLNARLAWERAQ